MSLRRWFIQRFGVEQSEQSERGQSRSATRRPNEGSELIESDADSGWELEPLEFEITDVLDLHSFPPKEVKDVVRDYLDAAYEKGYRRLRIIHGRGVGVQRRTVRALLERDARVVSFQDAEAGAGGWGATVVDLE